MTYVDQDRCVTLEDLHGEVREEEAYALHETNKCELYGFHRGDCPMKTYKDIKDEFWAEMAIGQANGK